MALPPSTVIVRSYSLREESIFSKEFRQVTLDRIDIAILDTLQKDGRFSNAA
jgi:hypothetical protein